LIEVVLLATPYFALRGSYGSVECRQRWLH